VGANLQNNISGLYADFLSYFPINYTVCPDSFAIVSVIRHNAEGYLKTALGAHGYFPCFGKRQLPLGICFSYQGMYQLYNLQFARKINFVGVIGGFVVVTVRAGKEKQYRYALPVKGAMVAWACATAVHT
jgi:hypothetical protein